VRQTAFDKQIILVDDGSTDGSADLLRRYENDDDVLVLRHPTNRGKGAALRTAFAEASGDYVLIQDADLEYDPADYARLLEPLIAGRADVVFGSRFAGSEPHRVLHFWHSLGNRLLTLLSNLTTGLNLTDMEVCYKIFRREVIARLTIEEDGFGVEPELTAKVAKLRGPDRKPLRVCEIGIAYYGRTYEEGKKIGPRDGLWAAWCILKYGRRGGEGVGFRV